MKKMLFLAIILFTLANMTDAQKTSYVVINTNLGSMKVKLYNETPLHRDNFIKLANSNFYDSLLFHRVIANFMIQAGDPMSKNAKQGAQLGSGGPGYNIPAEIKLGLIHKKGVLSAARLGDQQNPKRESSGSQFYIVQGSKITDEQLNQTEAGINNQIKQQLIWAYILEPKNAAIKAKIDSLYRSNKQQELNTIAKEIETKIEPQFQQQMFKYSPAMRENYTKNGGTPHLDMNYTVFGELIEGFEVLDKIAAVKTAPGDRPLENVIIISTSVITE